MMARALIIGTMASLLAACAAAPSEIARGPSSPSTSRPNQSPPSTTVRRPAPLPTPPVSATPPQPVDGFRSPRIISTPGLEWVIGKDARSLDRTFGQARLNVAEGDARKIQYSGPACVLDIILYPLQPGADPVATYVEARRASDGVTVSTVDCANALRR